MDDKKRKKKDREKRAREAARGRGELPDVVQPSRNPERSNHPPYKPKDENPEWVKGLVFGFFAFGTGCAANHLGGHPAILYMTPAGAFGLITWAAFTFRPFRKPRRRWLMIASGIMFLIFSHNWIKDYSLGKTREAQAVAKKQITREKQEDDWRAEQVAKLNDLQKQMAEANRSNAPDFDQFTHGYVIFSATKNEIIPFRGLAGERFEVNWNTPNVGSISSADDVVISLPTIRTGNCVLWSLSVSLPRVDKSGLAIGINTASQNGGIGNLTLQSNIPGQIVKAIGATESDMEMTIVFLKRYRDADIVVVGLQAR